MNPKTKANIKRVLNVFWHLEPTSDIYMFHHVTMTPEVERSCCKLDTEDFVHFLDQKRDYVSLDALTDDKRYPRKAAITFDDGLEDTFTVAYPILRRRQIPFTVFVLSHMVGQPGYLSAEQLKKMQRDPLVTIGVHGSKHRILTECTPEEQAEEIFASKQVLEKLLSKGKNGTFVALTLFIGIPLPGTGAWTGTLAASILNMGFKKSVIAAMLG